MHYSTEHKRVREKGILENYTVIAFFTDVKDKKNLKRKYSPGVTLKVFSNWYKYNDIVYA